MAFNDDIRLPIDIERGAKGGPGFSTTVIMLTSGAEKRNKNWQRRRGTYNIAYGITTIDELQAVIDTFYVVDGRGDGFRFKDWADFQIGDTLLGDTGTKQQIGTGDHATTLFSIYKRYTRGSVVFDRRIFKPVVGTVRVFLDSTEKALTTDFTVDSTLGNVHFVSPPGGSKAIGTLTFTGQPADTETVTIGAKVYTFQTTLTNTDGHVHIGASTANSIANLVAAITLGAGAGSAYAAATTLNAANVTASVGAGTTVDVQANDFGAAANSIATTETITNASWGAVTLINGSDIQLVYVMCEFDVPVRFDMDDLGVTAENFVDEAIISIDNITLKELKDPT